VDSDNSSVAMASMARLATRLQEARPRFTIPRVPPKGRGQQGQRQQTAAPYCPRGRGGSRGRGRGRGSATVSSQSGTKGQNPQ
jgi:hypothetical protein